MFHRQTGATDESERNKSHFKKVFPSTRGKNNQRESKIPGTGGVIVAEGSILWLLGRAMKWLQKECVKLTCEEHVIA